MSSFSSRAAYVIFFMLTLIISWSFWSFGILIGGLTTSVGFLFYVVGGASPLVVAIIVLGVDEGLVGVGRLFSRMKDFRGLSFNWFLVILGVVFLPVIIPVVLWGAVFNSWTAITNLVAFLAAPLGIAFTIIFNLIAVILEEPGWRGYALDRLQDNHNALTSSLILGFIWAIWHVPLFVMPGTFQISIGLGTPGFWIYMITIFATTLLITWVYNNNDGSLFAAILFHLFNNLAGEMFSLELGLETLRLIASYVIVVAVLYFYGSKRLAKVSSSDDS